MKKIFLFASLAASTLSVLAQGGFKDGVDYFKADLPEEAEIILVNTINDPATNKALAYYYLGEIALQKKDLTSAAADFEKGISADPSCGFNYIGKGQIALMNKNEGEADKLIKEGIGCDKKDGALYAAAARAYFNVDPVAYAKKIEKYVADGNKATKFKSADIFVLQGDMITDRPGDAAAQYETAIVTAADNGAPVSPEAYVKYANVYKRVNSQYAIDMLIKLNEAMPNSALAQRALAEGYYDNDQFTRAAEQYAKYMQNPNHFVKDEQRYSGLLFFGKKYEESLAQAQKVLAKEPNNFYMERMVVYNLYELKRYEEAKDAVEKLFAITPKNQLTPKDYEYEGDIYMALKDYPAAVKAYTDGVAAFPERYDILDQLAAAYTANGNYEEAAKTMQKYCDTGDRSLNDLWDLADYYKNWGLSLPEGSDERAAAAAEGLKAIDAAIEKAPNAGQLYRTKSQLYQVGNSEPNIEAADAYKKMIECYTANDDIEKRKSQIVAGYMYIGQYYAFIKDMSEAKANYEQALALDPDNEGLANYIKTLK